MAEYLAVLELSSLDGRNGFQISGEAADNETGFCVSSAGDVNNDGFADFLVSAPGGSPNSKRRGQCLVCGIRQGV